MVTGSGQGIGGAIARRFAREGCRIVVAEWNADTGPLTVKDIEERGGQGIFVKTDVSDKEQAHGCVQAAVDEWGRVDILVNNAWSGGGLQPFEKKTDRHMEHGWRMGTMSGYWTMQAAFPHMKDQGGGAIVNICSLNGVNAHKRTLEYNASKEALRAITRTAAAEWRPYNIRCNVICPGADTPTARKVLSVISGQPPPADESVDDRIRESTEWQIGGAALFLASDDSVFVTGNTLFVDGGTHINGSNWDPGADIDIDFF